MLTGMLCAVNTSSARSWSAGGNWQRVTHACRIGFDESGVRVPVPDVGDLDVGQPALPQRRARRGDVLFVLGAARIAALRRGDDADGPPHPARDISRKRVSEERMPVAHPDVDRQRTPPPPAVPAALGLPHRQRVSGETPPKSS